MNKYIVIIEDDWKGHAKKQILQVVKEDDERYLCTKGVGCPTIILNKTKEYQVEKKHKEGSTIYSCFGVDEKILDYVMLNCRLKDTKDHIELDDESEKILHFLKKYQQNFKHLFTN